MSKQLCWAATLLFLLFRDLRHLDFILTNEMEQKLILPSPIGRKWLEPASSASLVLAEITFCPCFCSASPVITCNGLVVLYIYIYIASSWLLSYLGSNCMLSFGFDLWKLFLDLEVSASLAKHNLRLIAQIAMWLILWWKPVHIVTVLSKMFFAGKFSLNTAFFCDGLSASCSVIPIRSTLSLYSGRCFFVCSPWISSLWGKVIISTLCFLLHMHVFVHVTILLGWLGECEFCSIVYYLSQYGSKHETLQNRESICRDSELMPKMCFLWAALCSFLDLWTIIYVAVSLKDLRKVMPKAKARMSFYGFYSNHFGSKACFITSACHVRLPD